MDEAVPDPAEVMTSARANPRLPSIRRPDVQALRDLVLQDVMGRWKTTSVSEWALASALDLAVRALADQPDDLAAIHLKAVARALGIVLPSGTSGGEQPQ